MEVSLLQVVASKINGDVVPRGLDWAGEWGEIICNTLSHTVVVPYRVGDEGGVSAGVDTRVEVFESLYEINVNGWFVIGVGDDGRALCQREGFRGWATRCD